MKRTITILLFLSIYSLQGFSQNSKVDSIREVLQHTTKPIQRFELLNAIYSLQASIKGSYVDSAICMEMLNLAQELNTDSTLAISYNLLAIYFQSVKGDPVSGMEYLFKALPYAEKTGDKRWISSIYFDLGQNYLSQGDLASGKKYTEMGRENLPAKSHPLYNFMLVQYQINMTGYFMVLGNADSAFYYGEKIKETNARTNYMPVMDYAYNLSMAGVYDLKGNFYKADSLYSICLTQLPSIAETNTGYFFYKAYLPFLLKNNRLDEAYMQAHACLYQGKKQDKNYLKLLGATFLRQIFEDRTQTDSAYYYSRKETTLAETIYNLGNQNKIQSFLLNDQLRKFESERQQETYQTLLKQYVLIGGLLVLLVIGLLLFRNNKLKQKANTVLESTLTNLKFTQSQLIQSEKMASLGELTAGIAHEIQNPLNFVNNFSEVSNELIDEMKDELKKGNYKDAEEIANDVKQNLEKINHHGKRAGEIVKGMLQHSRSSSGVKEPTDINALCDEYLRLSYHGLRAKDKSFNATMKTDFDNSIGKINIIPQDIGRVVLNLINNAFYACAERSRSAVNERLRQAQPDNTDVTLSLSRGYEPTVSVSTSRSLSFGEGRGEVTIKVTDNGTGIPQKNLDKIFQPFFTTKPTGEGTGLGLSLSYDIIKAHGGELSVQTKVGEGSSFTIVLPIS